MFCTNCGSKIEEGKKFCNECGTKVVQEEKKEEQVTTQEPVFNQTGPSIPTDAKPVDNQNKKGNNTVLIMIIIFIAIIGVSVGAFFLIKGLTNSGSSSEQVAKDAIKNTTWYASDNSELVFEENRLYWYEKPSVHDDNYYSGIYRFYIGKEAVKYITTELSEYGVTKTELEDIFKRNDQYDESNFIVIDVRYDKFVLNGKDQTINRSLMPMYGFILNNNTYLDVANMNTGSYYGFTKK